MSITTWALDRLPEGAVLHGVTAGAELVDGRAALRVELTDEITFDGVWGVDYVDQPTFVELPTAFATGVIEVEVRSRLNGKGPADARAFAGIAYRIVDSPRQFECVYLRPLNGAKVDPPAPRHERAVQHFAFPDWPFDVLREQRPGQHEAGAQIGPDEWTTLRIEADDDHTRVLVNGTPVLRIDGALVAPRRGNVGLFVDIGTEAWFRDLRIDDRASWPRAGMVTRRSARAVSTLV